MKQMSTPEGGQELSALCNTARELMEKGSYQECEALIAAAMGRFPHAPQPHNLIGILFEKMGDRIWAMKHFSAARALDPGYLPARSNLERFASFQPKEECAFDETDCLQEPISGSNRIEYDKQGIGHAASLGKYRLNIFEVPIAQTAPVAGKRIWEISLPPEVIIGCISRGGQNIVPCGDTRILAGDVLTLISAGRQEMAEIRKLTDRS